MRLNDWHAGEMRMLYKLVNQSRWCDCFRYLFSFRSFYMASFLFANGVSLWGINIKT